MSPCAPYHRTLPGDDRGRHQDAVAAGAPPVGLPARPAAGRESNREPRRRVSTIRQSMLYRTILANPPWGVSTQRAGRGAEHHYPLMPIETIAALRLDRLVGDDASVAVGDQRSLARTARRHGSLELQLPVVSDVDQAAATPLTTGIAAAQTTCQKIDCRLLDSPQ
jgi:hypothetical protein